MGDSGGQQPPPASKPCRHRRARVMLDADHPDREPAMLCADCGEQLHGSQRKAALPVSFEYIKR